MIKRTLSFLLCACLLLASAGARAFDLDDYRLCDANIRALYLTEDGGCIAGLHRDAQRLLHVVRRDAQGALVYDAALPTDPQETGTPFIDSIWPLPDGRHAVVVQSGYGLGDGASLFFLSPAGQAERGFALPEGTIAAKPCHSGLLLLLRHGGEDAARMLTLLDWQGNTLFEDARAAYGKARTLCVADADGRVFAILDAAPGSLAVCADASGVLWTQPVETPPGGSALTSLLPDGEGGLYAAGPDDGLRQSRGRVIRLDAEGNILFDHAVRCDLGAISAVLLTWRRGEPVLVGTTNGKGCCRGFALPLGEAGRLDGRKLDAWEGNGVGLRLMPDGAPCLTGTRYGASEDGNATLSYTYLFPFLDLPQAGDVNVWLE